MEKRFNTPEAADFLGRSSTTLAGWRSKDKVRIPYGKIGGRVYYLKSDLVAFLESNKFTSTKEYRHEH